ncbi:META domain-containing protein [Rhodobacteraceae bacterium]|nr:META domain-containing protein [Paracoccaceae bacterium]
MRFFYMMSLFVSLSACQADEIVEHQQDMPTRAQLTAWNMSADVRDVSAILGVDDISGQAHCNRFRGQVSFNEATGSIAIGPLISTRMACPQLSSEAEFLSQLQSVSTFTKLSNGIELRTPTGETFRFEPVTTP